VSAPAVVEIQVRDGISPTATISSPRQGQRVKSVPRASLALKGTVRDVTGVRSVELALRYIGPARSAAATCPWYTGSKLRKSSCTKPVWVKAKLAGTKWTYSLRKPRGLKKGFYELRVRGTDTDDNVSTVFAVSRKSILVFRLG
jgi:hypothetical protein